MNKSLLGVKIAMLVANGFTQDDMIAAQKALIAAGANVRIVSPENGLVNGWEGQGWGHHFAVDSALASALGADYEMLVIPAGQRSMEKLNLTGHTKRFVTSFMDAEKPVIVMGDALHIMLLTDNIRNHTVGGPETMGDVVLQAGGNWQGEKITSDGWLLTGAVADDNRAEFVANMVSHLETYKAGEGRAEQAA